MYSFHSEIKYAFLPPAYTSMLYWGSAPPRACKGSDRQGNRRPRGPAFVSEKVDIANLLNGGTWSRTSLSQPSGSANRTCLCNSPIVKVLMATS